MTEVLRFPARRARSNHAEVARAIGTSIVNGDFPPGSKLPGDAALTERFGISRPVLREGIKTLAAKGLLTSKARVGTVVVERSRWNMFDPDVLTWHLEAGFGVDFLRELAEIRMAVEPHAASMAAQRRTRSDITAMQASLQQMAEAASDAPAFAEADLALHLAVAGASGNRFMSSVGGVIEAALRASFRLSAPVDPSDRARVMIKHAEIVGAIEDGDADGAAQAMAAVILNGLDRHGALGEAGPQWRVE